MPAFAPVSAMPSEMRGKPVRAKFNAIVTDPTTGLTSSGTVNAVAFAASVVEPVPVTCVRHTRAMRLTPEMLDVPVDPPLLPQTTKV